MEDFPQFDEVVVDEKKRLLTLFLDVVIASCESELCDVVLVVTDSLTNEVARIGSTKSRLKEQSTFFAALWKDAPPPTDGKLDEVVLDCTIAGMRGLNAVAFQQFGWVKMDASLIAQYWFAAHKYNCAVLERSCQKWMVQRSAQLEHLEGCMRVCGLLNRPGMSKKSGECVEKLVNSEMRANLALSGECVASIVGGQAVRMGEEDRWRRCEDADWLAYMRVLKRYIFSWICRSNFSRKLCAVPTCYLRRNCTLCFSGKAVCVTGKSGVPTCSLPLRTAT